MIPWPDSDILVDDLVAGGEILERRGIWPARIKVSGGEPTLHPQLDECCKAIHEKWKGHRTRLYVNDTNPVSVYPGIKPYKSPANEKEFHSPPMISPADLGLNPVFGFVKACNYSMKCGRLFDAFGFSFCPVAGVMGRILRIDPYSSHPVMIGREDMCKHCVFSQTKKVRFKLWNQARNGEIDHPSKTYRRGIVSSKEDGSMKFKRFAER
jgi:hypothetical protein